MGCVCRTVFDRKLVGLNASYRPPTSYAVQYDDHSLAVSWNGGYPTDGLTLPSGGFFGLKQARRGLRPFLPTPRRKEILLRPALPRCDALKPALSVILCHRQPRHCPLSPSACATIAINRKSLIPQILVTAELNPP